MNEREYAEQIKKEYNQLKNIRSYWDGAEGLWQKIANYFFPLREDLQGTEVKGRVQGTKIYEGTAVAALNTHADGIFGNMFNPALEWFFSQLPNKYRNIEKQFPEIRLWMRDMTESLYATLKNSNFYSEWRMFLKDGSGIGTASLYIDEDLVNDRLCFHTLHPKECYIAENKYREIDKFIRRFKLTARQAYQSFGDRVSENIRKSYKDSPYTEYEFLHYVSPRAEYDSRKIGNIDKPFASVWLELQGNKILRESGFDLFPYIIWRYSLQGNDVYGRSPAAYALPEVMGANVIQKSVYGAAQLTVEPPYNIPAEMKGKVRLTPHGSNYYGSDYNRRIYPVNTGITFPISTDIINGIKELINEFYNVPFFKMLAQAERQMTVVEIMERVGEKATMLAAMLAGLLDTTDRLLDYVFYMETKAGRIPPMPQILMDIAGGEQINYVYTGTLAQAQKRTFETQGILKGLELILPLLQMYPNALDEINGERTVNTILVANGFPQDALNSQDEKDAIRKARSEAQMQESMKIDQERMAEVLKKLAQASKNSPELSAQIQGMLGTGAGGGAGIPAEKMI